MPSWTIWLIEIGMHFTWLKDLMRDLLYDAIKNEIDIMCPQKNIKIKKKKDPWITNDLLELRNDKNDLLDIAKNTQSDDDWQAARIA